MDGVSISFALIGFFLGFAFGVGCALAVMYSIYMGGYRAAVRDSILPQPPERLQKARSRALQTQAAAAPKD
jgi:ABC-type antimicrobial peptide transport system permease subunit